MTMFKTEEQIEEMAKGFEEGSAEHGYHRAESYRGFRLGYIKAQQDILKSASKEKEEAWVNYRKGEGHSFGHKEALEYGWQAAKLSSKTQIDTLKQRELGYQSDLRQKDAEIDRLKKKISSFDAYASADEKYQEAVKDIAYLEEIASTLLLLGEKNTKTTRRVQAIRTKYGLDKKEG